MWTYWQNWAHGEWVSGWISPSQEGSLLVEAFALPPAQFLSYSGLPRLALSSRLLLQTSPPRTLSSSQRALGNTGSTPFSPISRLSWLHS